MYFPFTRMRRKGVARDWKVIRQTVGIRGDINISPQMCSLLNRSSDIAEPRPQGMLLAGCGVVAAASRRSFVMDGDQRFHAERLGRNRQRALRTTLLVSRGLTVFVGRTP